MKSFQSLNIKQFFDDYDIKYHKSGEKNVTKGWINISCPFCSDPSWHCGINLKSKIFHCFSCQKKGSPIYLIKTLFNISYSKSENLISKYLTEEIQPERIIIPNKEVFLPEEIEKTFPQLHLNYLKKRGFNESIIKKYDLKACYQFGKYAYRIIIPYYYNNKLVTFTSRDVTGKSNLRYLTLSKEKGIFKTTDTLYNVDNVFGDSVIIVEGPTDVWNIGNSCVALSTDTISNSQIKMLLNKKIKKAVILLDSGKTDNAEMIAAKLSMFMNVKIKILQDGDPAEMNEKQIKQIRKEL